MVETPVITLTSSSSPTHPSSLKYLEQSQPNKKGQLLKDESKCVGLASKYCFESSVHGLKYITERNRHWSERLFWFLACSFSWVVCIYMISKVFEKWSKSPILVAFDSASTPIWEIPFPSVTICNMNKVRLSRVKSIEEEIRNDPNNTFYSTKRRFVDEFCATHENVEHIKHDELKEKEGDFNFTGEILLQHIQDLSLSCEDLIVRCFFGVSSALLHYTLQDIWKCLK